MFPLAPATGQLLTDIHVDFFSAERVDITRDAGLPVGKYTVSVLNPDNGIAAAVLNVVPLVDPAGAGVTSSERVQPVGERRVRR